MKRSIFTLFFVAAGLGVSASSMERSDDAAENSGGIVAVRDCWADKTLSVVHGRYAATIKEFTYAFCSAYPQFETNTAMKNYIDDPKGSVHPDIADLELDTTNGYITYRACPSEYCNELNTSCWKRVNGHWLFAAFMQAEHENNQDEVLIVFYDYNPTTDILTPEPAIARFVENRMAGYSKYTVRLPQDGKDIILVGYVVDESNDSATSVEQRLMWNGTDFE